jgi:3-methyladenine DNA glycosylase/8-oxoguanine DNA glycosylase
VANTASFIVDGPLDLAATLFNVKGPGGTTASYRNGVLRYASRNPAGPVQLAITRADAGVFAEAWGSGAGYELENIPRLLGLDDDPGGFDPPPGPIAEFARRDRGLRLGSTGRVFEVLAPSILGQRVTTDEAKRAYRSLLRSYGEPAPGPPGLTLPLQPEAIAPLAYEEFHRHEIERSRAQILREVARRAKRLEQILTMDRTAAYDRLEAIRGVGPWTSGHVMGIAWGDRDAVPVGDFHLPNTVSWLLAGEPRGDDDRMLELLEPYRPHRRRAVLLIKRSGVGAPKYGPKVAANDIRGK